MRFVLCIMVVIMCGCSNLITVRDAKNNLVECDCSKDYTSGHPCINAVKQYREQHKSNHSDRNRHGL